MKIVMAKFAIDFLRHTPRSTGRGKRGRGTPAHPRPHHRRPNSARFLRHPRGPVQYSTHGLRLTSNPTAPSSSPHSTINTNSRSIAAKRARTATSPERQLLSPPRPEPPAPPPANLSQVYSRLPSGFFEIVRFSRQRSLVFRPSNILGIQIHSGQALRYFVIEVQLNLAKPIGRVAVGVRYRR
jgi:hypothetical protein